MPETISGYLKMWDMSFSQESFEKIRDLSSDKKEEMLKEYDLEKRRVIATYKFSSKKNCLELLEKINKSYYLCRFF